MIDESYLFFFMKLWHETTNTNVQHFCLLVLLEIQCFSINYFSEPIITGEHSFHGLLAEVV